MLQWQRSPFFLPSEARQAEAYILNHRAGIGDDKTFPEEIQAVCAVCHLTVRMIRLRSSDVGGGF